MEHIGHFRSDVGDALLYVDTAKPPFIYLDTGSAFILINCSTEANTQVLYQELKASIGQ